MAASQRSMDELATVPSANTTKVFLHRDFSDGTAVRFSTKFPSELEGKIDRSILEQTVNRVNAMQMEAEALGGWTYCESCCACLTAYLSYICFDTHYEKTLKKIGRYIEEQNKTIYFPRGMMLVNPAERGLRVLEICIFNDPSGSR